MKTTLRSATALACSFVFLCAIASAHAQTNTPPKTPAFDPGKTTGIPLQTERRSSPLARSGTVEPMPALSTNEFGTKAGDAGATEMGAYQCRSSGVSSIDFQINVPHPSPQLSASTLKMAVYDVDTNTEAGNPEIDTVTVNGTKVGILNGGDGAWFYNIFNIPVGLLKTGTNNISVSVDDNYPQRTSGTNWCVQIDWGIISLTGTVGGSGVQIPRAWLTPTQVTGGSYINFFAEVAGSGIASVKAYYNINNQMFELSTLTDPDGDHVYSGSFQMPELPTGFYSGFQLIATDSFGNKAYWPGLQAMPRQVAINYVTMAQLAGKYLYTDTTRPQTSYYELLNLSANGACTFEEFKDGVSEGVTPCTWSFDPSTKRFHLTYNSNAYDDGIITGDTSTFTLTGKWYSGDTKTVTFSRLPN
jgi:hypothetical protein